MGDRFAVSDVVGEEEGPGSSAGANGHTTSPQLSPQAGVGEDRKGMDYLSVDNSNMIRNQLTVTSVASGNLALYEVLTPNKLCNYVD